MLEHPTTSDAERFLKLWFGRLSGPTILIWTNPGKRSTWFPANQLDRAAAFAVSQFDKHVYFGTSPAEKAYQANQRLHSKLRPAVGMVGLHSDIDVTGPEHKKKIYPATVEDALKIVADVSIEPTIITNTGGGVHVYWCFEEPWIFKDDEDRARAQQLARRWHRLLLDCTEARGYTMDNVSDLERVMRLPGTWNVKGKNPKPVTILEEGARRYSPEDFDTMLPVAEPVEVVSTRISKTAESHPTTAQARVVTDGKLKLFIGAEPPTKFNALLAATRKIRETWEHKRADLKDQSGSSYDLAMANYCVKTGYSLQETVNVLIAMRRKHHDPNLQRKMREGYFRGTYEKAFKPFAEQHRKVTAIEKSRDAPAEDGLKVFNDICGTHFTEARRQKTDDYEFRFEHTEGEFIISGDDFFYWSKFRRRYMVFTGMKYKLPALKQGEWEEVCAIIAGYTELSGRTLVIVGEGSQRTDMGRWVDAYLSHSRPAPEFNEDAFRAGHYFVDSENGDVHIRSDELRLYIAKHWSDRITSKAMPSLLRSAGLEPSKSPRKIINTNRTCRMWVLHSPKVVPFPVAEERKVNEK